MTFMPTWIDSVPWSVYSPITLYLLPTSRRQFTGLQNFGFTLTNSSVLIGIVPLFGFGMATGGPVVAIWGWVIVAFFVMFIGLGMAEICSTYPTAGGLYFWTAKL